MRKRHWSLARQLLVLQVAVVGVLVAGALIPAYLDAARVTEDRAADEVTAVAVTVRDSPSVRAALTRADPSLELQPFAERVRRDTDVDFVTIMNPSGVRYSHPNPELIGQRFIGHTESALRGEVLTETYTGTLGPSLRTVAPVFGADGEEIIGLVAVGITVTSVAGELAGRVPGLLLVALGVLIAGVGGSILVSARLRRQTRGVAPAELSQMFEYYEAILGSVREGLLLVGRDGRIRLCNDAARELLDLAGDPRGVAVADIGLADDLVDAVTAAETRSDEIHLADTRVLVVNVAPVRSGGRDQGTVVTLRDHTELQSLTGELNTVRGFAESLRSQAHESANRLHTVVSLVELGRTNEAVDFATAELVTAQQLTDRVVGAVSEPVLAALLLGKSAEADERGVELVLSADTSMQDAESSIDARDLVTILGNLVDNAIDAAVENAETRSAKVTVTVRAENGGLLVRVADTGGGVAPEVAQEMFRRGWSTKSGGSLGGRGLGLALVGQAVRRHGGTIEIGSDLGAVFTVRLPAGPRGSGVG
ncbi:ATP-binding protein [Actinoalloteichus hymeniacidonis]|nr:sensor histidine kinase [Actinoalloteichus hymeniacidonis]MBB5907678.1 sensor histidine kinase regulating citrate/malate metabolism [Actinoalloteichus hymeniacidonis]